MGLSVMLYPTVSDYVNQRHQSRALASYDETVNEMSDADYTAYFEAADAYNQRLAATPNAVFTPEQVSGYDETLDVSGTGIMGYITIPRIGVELPVYHGISDGVLQVAAGHLEGSSLPVGGAGTHAVISAHRGLPSAKLFTDLDQLAEGAGSLCGNADLLVVEDLEAFVCGTEQWQRGCAFFFQNIIEDGTDVIAAADDPAKTAPEFWYRMTCACPFSVRTLKE